MDIRVEREIAEALPEHADRQQAYFRRQVADLVPHFAPEMAELAPSRTYRAVSAMNVALGIVAAEVASLREPAAFRTSPHCALAVELHSCVHGVTVRGRVGDIELTDPWAGRLGLVDAYRGTTLQM